MGTPLPENEPGELCPSCWGVNKPFGPGPSPKVIQLRLLDLEAGALATEATNALILQPRLLEQTNAPCTYEIEASGFLYRLNFSLQFTTLVVERISDGKRAFLDDFPPACQTSFPNALDDGDDHIAFNGRALIQWSREGLD